MAAPNFNRRKSSRKKSHLEVGTILLLSGNFVGTGAHVLDVSSTAMHLRIPRKNLCERYRSSFSLDELIQENICIFLKDFQLDLLGCILSIRPTQGKNLDVILEMDQQISESWIECFKDMLPDENGRFSD